MVTVVIMGIAAALAGPSLGRDSAAARGRAYAEEVGDVLRRARMEAVSTRLPRYAFIYSDRVEIRAARPGATPTAPALAPTTSDPVLYTVQARAGVLGLDVRSTPGTPTAQLSTATAKQLVFNTLGAGYIAPTPPVGPEPVYLYIANDTVAAGHPDRQLRVEVAALSGQVTLARGW
jgi:Tfp pilus assembly protein FimT